MLASITCHAMDHCLPTLENVSMETLQESISPTLVHATTADSHMTKQTVLERHTYLQFDSWLTTRAQLDEASKEAETQRLASLQDYVKAQTAYDNELMRDILKYNCSVCRDALTSTAWIMDFDAGLPIDKTGHCNKMDSPDKWQHLFLQWMVRRRLYDALDTVSAYTAVRSALDAGIPCNNCAVLRPVPPDIPQPPPVRPSDAVVASATNGQGKKAPQLPPSDLTASIVWRVPYFGTRAAEVVKAACNIIDGMRSSHNNLMNFKIGITQDLNRRWLDPGCGYKKDKYDKLIVLFKSNGMACALLEVHLISKYKGMQGCQNEAPGGEGIANGGEGVEVCYVYVAIRVLAQFPPNDPRYKKHKCQH